MNNNITYILFFLIIIILLVVIHYHFNKTQLLIEKLGCNADENCNDIEKKCNDIGVCVTKVPECTLPPTPIINGSVIPEIQTVDKKYTYPYGKIRFTCDNGYEMINDLNENNDIRTCSISGDNGAQWNTTVNKFPKCTKICKQNEYLDKKNNSNTCKTCPEGTYNDNASHTKTECDVLTCNATEKNKIEYTPGTLSGKLVYVNNNIDNNDYTIGSTKKCNSIYENTEQSTCIFDSVSGKAIWDKTITCVKKPCSGLPSINGNSMEYTGEINKQDGFSMSIKCKQGYFSSGTTIRTCSGGNIDKWSGNNPSCNPIPCYPKGVINNGYITSLVGYNNLFTYSHYKCNSGYEKNSVVLPRCNTPGGTVNAPTNGCKATTCSSLQPYVRIVSGGAASGRRISEFYLNGTKLIGTTNNRGFNIIYLDSNDAKVEGSANFDTHNWPWGVPRWMTWNGNSIKMLQWVLSIPKDRIVMVSVKDEATRNFNYMGIQALRMIGVGIFPESYRCSYIAVGRRLGGVADTFKPYAISKPQELIDVTYSIGKYSQNNHLTYNGAKTTLTCKEGYDGQVTRTCNTDKPKGSRWSLSNPTCTPKGCGIINLANGSRTDGAGNVHGAEAKFKCNDGYAGTMYTKTCNKGNWTGSTNTCKKKSLPARAPAGCFPLSSRVRMDNHTDTLMSTIDINDTLANNNKVTNWIHYETKLYKDYVKIYTDRYGSIITSKNHVIKLYNGSYMLAGSLLLNDTIIYVDKNNTSIPAKIIKIEQHVHALGLCAPLTSNGELIVNGFKVSCYAFGISKTFYPTVMKIPLINTIIDYMTKYNCNECVWMGHYILCQPLQILFKHKKKAEGIHPWVQLCRDNLLLWVLEFILLCIIVIISTIIKTIRYILFHTSRIKRRKRDISWLYN